MRRIGAIVAVVAGIFGVLAGMLTLFVGGAADLPETDPAAQAVYRLGWQGIVISLVVVALGAVSIYTPARIVAILLIVAAAIGVLLGGGLVSMAMGVAVVGGILALFGDQPATRTSREPPP